MQAVLRPSFAGDERGSSPKPSNPLPDLLSVQNWRETREHEKA